MCALAWPPLPPSPLTYDCKRALNLDHALKPASKASPPGPPITLDSAYAQRVHRSCIHRNSTQLTDCQLLAPAGTGSSFVDATLRQAMAPLLRRLCSVSYAEIPAYKNASMHRKDHMATIEVWARRWDPRCFLMTLRDPVERLESGFCFEMRNYKDMMPRMMHWETLQALVHSIRNTSDKRHASAIKFVRQSKYKRNVGGPGSNFMQPQIGYLRGVDCLYHEVHFLCTKTVSTDVSALLRDTFGVHADVHLIPNNRSALLATEQQVRVGIVAGACSRACVLKWDPDKSARAHDCVHDVVATHSLTHSFTHSLTHSLAHPSTHPLTHSPTQGCARALLRPRASSFVSSRRLSWTTRRLGCMLLRCSTSASPTARSSARARGCG